MLFIILIALPAFVFTQCPEDRRTPETSWEAKLHNDIFCDFTHEPPVKNKSHPVEVKTRMIVKHYSFDSNEEILTVHSWIMMLWQDEFLTWNASDYGGVNEVIVESHQIWIPELALLNVREEMLNTDGFYSTCSVDNTGLVMCAPHLYHLAFCKSSLENWPYDEMTCNLTFGSRAFVEKVHFVFLASGIMTAGAESCGAWNLINVTKSSIYQYDKDKFKSELSYNFKLRRHAAGIGALTLFPSIAAAFLTLVSLTMNIEDNTRLSISIFSLLIHFFLLTSISDLIPRYDKSTPKILLFVRNSTLLTALIILLTLLLQYLRKLKTPSPIWMVSLTSYVEGSWGRYLLRRNPLPPDADKVTTSSLEQWTYFSNLLNSLCDAIFYFVYLILMCTCLPF